MLAEFTAGMTLMERAFGAIRAAASFVLHPILLLFITLFIILLPFILLAEVVHIVRMFTD